jgi:hypothetical protein
LVLVQRQAERRKGRFLGKAAELRLLNDQDCLPLPIVTKQLRYNPLKAFEIFGGLFR